MGNATRPRRRNPRRQPIGPVIVVLMLIQPGVAVAQANPPSTLAFIDSIGVGAHMAFGDTAYSDASLVATALGYLGVHHVRNLLQSRAVGPAAQARLESLAASGEARFNFIATNPDMGANLAWLDAFVTKFPGTIQSIEGPNEINHWPVAYAGQTGRDAGVAFQRELFRSVHADPLLAGVVVYNLTGLGSSYSTDLSDSVDFGNEHPYPRNGAPPIASILNEIAHTHEAVTPGKPMVATETGYPTLVGHPEIKLGRDGVSEATQQAYTLDLLVDFFKAGIARTFLYELLDEKPDPDGRRIDLHYGLFHADFTPKPAAVALHNLLLILGGPPAPAGSAPPSVSVSGLSADGDTLLLSAPDGGFDLLVWAEPRIWDSRLGVPIEPPAQSVTIRFGRRFAFINVFDPTLGPTETARLAQTDTAQVTVTDHPLVIHVSDSAG